MAESHGTLVAKDLRDVDTIHKRLSELWKKANEYLDIIAACENDKVDADAADKEGDGSETRSASAECPRTRCL